MEVQSGRDDIFVVVSKLNGGVLKIGENQEKVLGKIGVDGEENNNTLGNGLGDGYKHDRQ